MNQLCTFQNCASITYLVAPSRPPNLRKAHNAAIPSCCAATFESATAPFQSPGSCKNGRNAGSCSSGVISNCFAASSYAAFRTFHIYPSLYQLLDREIGLGSMGWLPYAGTDQVEAKNYNLLLAQPWWLSGPLEGLWLSSKICDALSVSSLTQRGATPSPKRHPRHICEDRRKI
jgi:hypothetical protein